MEDNTMNADVSSTVENQQTEPTVNGVEDATGQAPIEDTNTEQAGNTNDRFDDGDRVAKAFSKRLNKEKEKLSKEYEPFKRVVSLAAKQFNMTEEEYIQSILTDYGDDNSTATEKVKDERDILIEELLAEKREKEIASEWERQAKALQKIDAEVSMDKITDEMLSLADEKKIPLEYIYAFEMLTSGREAFEKAIETKIMAKINKVNTTAGSLNSSQIQAQPQSINSMSAKDFEALKERVKRGEKISL